MKFGTTEILRTLLHPYTTPGIGKALSKLDPINTAIDSTVANAIDPQYEYNKKYGRPTSRMFQAKLKQGGKVTRGDGCCVKGGTKGKYI